LGATPSWVSALQFSPSLNTPFMYLKKIPSTRLAEHPGHPQDLYPGLAGCWPCYLVGFFLSESPLMLLV
jgi:hypothetical protein